MLSDSEILMALRDCFDPEVKLNLVDLGDIPVPSEGWLRRVFNLTQAEARLAQAMTRGNALEQVARALRIKMPTARTQLAAIFEKTHTRRQPALVARLTRLASLSMQFEQSQRDAADLIEEAFAALAPYGSRADGLKSVARYLVERKN